MTATCADRGCWFAAASQKPLVVLQRLQSL